MVCISAFFDSQFYFTTCQQFVKHFLQQISTSDKSVRTFILILFNNVHHQSNFTVFMQYTNKIVIFLYNFPATML